MLLALLTRNAVIWAANSGFPRSAESSRAVRVHSCCSCPGWNGRRVIRRLPGRDGHERDYVLVTQDARDFRNLIGREDIHPGLIILPNVELPRTETLLRRAIDYLDDCGDPMDLMVNRILEIAEDGSQRIDAPKRRSVPPVPNPHETGNSDACGSTGKARNHTQRGGASAERQLSAPRSASRSGKSRKNWRAGTTRSPLG